MQTTTPHQIDAIHTVSENDAIPEIALIFADIKKTLGVPFVNLMMKRMID